MGNKVRFLTGIIVSTFFLILLLRDIDFIQLIEVISSIQILWICAAMVPYMFALILRALRWSSLLKNSIDISFSESMSIIMIGYATNNLLPIRLGEILRAIIIEKRYATPKMQVMGTIVIERLFDGLVLAIFLTIIIATLGNSSILQPLAIVAGIGFTLGTFFIALLALKASLVRKKMHVILSFTPNKFRPYLRQWLSNFITGLLALRKLKGFVSIISLSFLSWALEAIAFWFVGLSFGLSIHPLTYLGVVSAANLAMVAPSTSGGVGPFEFFGSEMLILLGIGSATAVAFIITVHIFVLLPVTLIGLILFWRLEASSQIIGKSKWNFLRNGRSS
tara:strand:- start:15054 stop:16058 length:1005 start_codon:yes stop_codon:yes gene_type:complete